MLYVFEYDEIGGCFDCPLFYDCYICMLDMERSWADDDFSGSYNKRPEWCKLREMKEPEKSS